MLIIKYLLNMNVLITEKQLEKLQESIDNEIAERARSFAHTRKKRLFPKSAMMANPARFKKYDREIKGLK